MAVQLTLKPDQTEKTITLTDDEVIGILESVFSEQPDLVSELFNIDYEEAYDQNYTLVIKRATASKK